MRLRARLFATGLALATAGSTHAALAAASRRVIVAGPHEDTIAARVQKELTALGFETVRLDALEGCARRAVVGAAQDLSATAVACSDGDQVGIWVAEGRTFRLRDVVVVREEGDPARETTAVRAAEVTRATIAMRDAEEEAARAKPAPAPPPPPVSSEWEDFDRPAAPPAKPVASNGGRAPTLLAAAGISSLMGIDASAVALSGKAEIGLLRHFTATGRIEYPLESPELGGGTSLRVAPAFAGVGIGVPLANADAFIIPRLGAGLGIAWVKATRPAGQGFDPTTALFVSTPEVSDSTSAFAVQADAGLSMRIYRALRLTVDGAFGTTTSRLVVRDRGTHVAYWGTPFGALALRAELMFK